MAARILRIYGRVQGVNFRSSLQRQADQLDLSGWVRNRRDGSVEALVCGEEKDIGEIIQWANTGPPLSQVDKVEATETGAFPGNSFDILPTA